MEVKKTHIEGLLIIKPNVFLDQRGYFFESYNQERYFNDGLTAKFVQDNLSKSSKDVLRGLHFQNPPHAQAKLVQVIQGSVWDVAVDLRKNSPTYGQHFGIELSDKNHLQFFIPEGFAHGFLTLEDETFFTYKCTSIYNRDSEATIEWNDKELNIQWPCENPIISEKDSEGKPFASFKSPF